MTNLQEADKSKIKAAYDEYLNGSDLSDDTSDLLSKIEELLKEKKAKLAKSNRTARLWVQLLEHVDTILLYIRAERLGDWEMHLTATHSMINLFAATGHVTSQSEHLAKPRMDLLIQKNGLIFCANYVGK